MNRGVFLICLATTIILLVAGFLTPPTGIIDGSVLTGCGILFAFATLATIPSVANGRSVTFNHGKTTLELGDND